MFRAIGDLQVHISGLSGSRLYATRHSVPDSILRVWPTGMPVEYCGVSDWSSYVIKVFADARYEELQNPSATQWRLVDDQGRLK